MMLFVVVFFVWLLVLSLFDRWSDGA